MDKWKWDVGKIYSTREMYELFGISKSTWDHKRNKYLDNFALYYEYEVLYQGRNTNYRIIKQLGDYRKPPSKKDKETIDGVYSKEIIDVIETDSLQTAANVSRIIKDNEPIKEFNHADGTVYEYTRLRMREMFGKTLDDGGTIGGILEKIWCRLDKKTNTYIPIGEVMEQKFFSLMKEQRDNDTDFDAEIYNDYEIGLITIEQRDQIIGRRGFSNYLEAKKRFYEIYGFHPVKVPNYGFYGKEILNFDEAKTKAA